MVLIYILVSVVAAILIMPVWAEILRMVGHTQTNYQGRATVQSMGGMFAFVFLVSAAWARIADLVSADVLGRALILISGLGVLGFVDDIYGDHKVKGFGGHFYALVMRGEVTTGLMKALGGFFVCIWAIAGLPGMFPLIIWRAVLVALSANLLNLFDLRPGRALKGFFFLALFYIWQVPFEEGILLLFPFLITSFVFLPWDLATKGMLGDVGSNMLGGVLGLAIVLTAPAGFQVLYMTLLIASHILAERMSLTKIIADNSVLRFIDSLGRTEWEKYHKQED